MTIATGNRPSLIAAPRPPVLVKLAYCLGQAAQNGGFDVAVGFVFFYYSAVLGLSGTLVGAALAVSLAFDAVVDPVVGSWSDNTRSRLGRRLPLMIASIPLIVIAIALLFAPPRGLGSSGLFVWLATFSVAVRSCISLFNVPYIALGAELTADYSERTNIVVYRAFAGLFAGLVVTAMGFSGFFANGGLQRPDSYPGFGRAVAVLLGVCLTLCCLGIARYAAALPQPEQKPGSTLRRLPGELREIFGNRSFRLLFGSAVVTFVAIGVNMSLNNHAFVFVWKIRSEQIQFIGYAYLAGILLGVMGAPLLQKVMEKKHAVIIGFLLLIGNWLVIQGLMLTGLYHPVGDTALRAMEINSFVAGIGTGFVSVAYPSMMADAADEHELLYGHRREGLYFAGLGFAGKAATGLGVMVAGVALDLIRFPHDPSHSGLTALPGAMQFRLVMIWGPVPAVFALVSLVILTAYGISRARYAEIARALAKARSEV
ncbi:MFS transporter [Novosphingobium sp.]|uniref:MFS transporter n=1 Tax=Novosphingobium sp. TaxID=1874826 RepID=UPI0025F9976A|nr:MFS transporter [Novosphingobium sp.]